MKIHHCSHCGITFEITAWNRVANTPGYIFNPFIFSGLGAIGEFSLVRCPHCSHEEHDESIRFLGFRPKVGFVVVAIVFILFMLGSQIWK